jgi:UDP-N-acetylmuramoylalanine--D-glutamate ligase
MRALVVGLAVSGRAAVDALRADGNEVVAYDARSGAAAGVEADRVVTGEWSPALLDGVDLVVPSPGVPETAAPVADALAAGLDVWSELELGWRRLSPAPPTGAVTGTNGKTTIVELVSAMLVASGLDAAAVGNIGEPISGSASVGHDALVVEASSFQLRFIDRFAPDAAVLVNFAPDHLDWHPDVTAYAAAKARIFENMTDVSPVIYDADDEGAARIVAAHRGRLVPVSGSRRIERSGPVGESMWLAGHRISTADLVRSDPIMLVDMAAAAELAAALGATGEGIVTGALGYTAGRHRREIVSSSGGVTWVDDSKATNPHAALAAIESYPSVVLIAGGRAKGLDIRPLAAAGHVRAVVAIGESAPVLLEERPDALTADSMDEAVERAAAIAREGDVVLLAPGCASFDMFDSYGHRGDVFAEAVRRRLGE